MMHMQYIVLHLMAILRCCYSPGKLSSMVEPRLHILLELLYLRTMYSSLIGPRWVW